MGAFELRFQMGPHRELRQVMRAKEGLVAAKHRDQRHGSCVVETQQQDQTWTSEPF
jgi:hypothetical protein